MWMNDNTKFVPVQNPNLSEYRTMPEIAPVEERTEDFDPIEETYTPAQAAEESARCLKCPTHWCQKGCPAGVPVTDFIALARSGQYEEAYQLIRTASMLPEFCSRVCPQENQCQCNCTRGIRTQAVGIGKLERFVVEQHYASGAKERKAQPTGKRVAVIGSGPAGLSAAQRLVDQGHSVVIYEKASRAGGLLEYGIPNMKLEKQVVERKLEALKAQGVEIRTGVNVGTDLSAQEILQKYDGVILAVGTGNTRKLNLEGDFGAQGIVPAVEYLTNTTRQVLDGVKPLDAKGKHVVIVGGGDTGNDCVGTALRQGCASIVQIEMLPKERGHQFLFEPHPPRAKEEKHDFSQEECALRFGDPHRYETTVKAVQTGNNGEVIAVTTVDLKPVYDNHFRLSMEEISGTQRTLPCDLLIVAAGFIGPEASVAQAFGVSIDGCTNYMTQQYQATGKVFACGDCRTGQSLVVKAMVDGRDCADHMNAFLAEQSAHKE
jgi:glutamate synthase (NADPH/NADH) small chain